MTKEALKLALEALEVANSCVDGYYIPKGKTHLPEIELAITAIREALAQPERQPLQQKCSDWGVYWRALDAHGVVLNTEQAVELLRDALGVEVEINQYG